MLNTLKKESFIWRQELTNSSIPEELLSELTNKSQIAVVTLYSDTDTGWETVCIIHIVHFRWHSGSFCETENRFISAMTYSLLVLDIFFPKA